MIGQRVISDILCSLIQYKKGVMLVIWYLGFDGDEIILYHSGLYQFKSLDRDKFLRDITGKSYSELYDLDVLKLQNIIDKITFPLKNKEDLCDGILNGKRCQYFLQINTNTYMTVATYKKQAEVVKRIDNTTKTLNAEVYWMTWPESEGYQYGSTIPCSAFEYVCEVGKSYQEAKAELLDFANTGLQEVLERQQVFGIETGYRESHSLKGLCSYEYHGEASIDVLEIEEGVAVLDEGAIPNGVVIDTLILPSTLMFIQPGAIQGEVNSLDMSKTSVTKMYETFNNYRQKNTLLVLPNSLVELSGINNKCSGRIVTKLPKSVRAIRDVMGLCYDIEEGSELAYLGMHSLCWSSWRGIYANTIYKSVTFNDMSVFQYGYILDTPNLQIIDGDVMPLGSGKHMSLIFKSARLKKMMKSAYTKLNKVSVNFLVEEDSELFKEVKGKLYYVRTYKDLHIKI